MQLSLKNTAMQIAKKKGYYVDDLGAVYNAQSKPVKLFVSAHYLAFGVRCDSYLGYRKSVNIHVHRYVAYLKHGDETFNPGIEVRHLNGDPFDNSSSNITIGTPSDNEMDKLPSVRRRVAIYASSFIRKYTDQEESEIRSYYHAHRSYNKTMARFGVKKATLFYLLHNERSRHE